MALGILVAIRNNMGTQIINAIDAGAGAGKLDFYNGTRPATGGTATTKLASLTCSDPCATVASGVVTFSAITQDSSADATGTASWARFTDSTGAFVADANVGTSGSDINLVTTSITATQPVSVTSATITIGNA